MLTPSRAAREERERRWPTDLDAVLGELGRAGTAEIQVPRWRTWRLSFVGPT